MKTNEIFPWPLEEGAACDYVDGRFILAVKDDEWNDEQLAAMKKDSLYLRFGTPMQLGLFLAEGGALDTCDFYFNIHECDEAGQLLESKEPLSIEFVLIGKDSRIVFERSWTLDKKTSEQIVSMLKKLYETKLMPGEFDVNMEGLMNSLEPAELARYAPVSWEMKR